MPTTVCRHCGKTCVPRCRGLCYRCYTIPDVLARYPRRVPWAYDHEPTAAELDAMIAEQMTCLPDWWAEADRAQASLEAAGFIPGVDQCAEAAFAKRRPWRKPSEDPRYGKNLLHPVRLARRGQRVV